MMSHRNLPCLRDHRNFSYAQVLLPSITTSNTWCNMALYLREPQFLSRNSPTQSMQRESVTFLVGKCGKQILAKAWYFTVMKNSVKWDVYHTKVLKGERTNKMVKGFCCDMPDQQFFGISCCKIWCLLIRHCAQMWFLDPLVLTYDHLWLKERSTNLTEQWKCMLSGSIGLWHIWNKWQ